MAKKYIVGDWVKFLFEESKVIEVYEDGSYSIDSPNVTGCPKEKELSPIPLTPEILEKNGWKKLYEKFFEKNVNNIRLTIEFSENIYVAINRIFIMEIHYIHELQHLLFGLGINHKMEVQV